MLVNTFPSHCVDNSILHGDTADTDTMDIYSGRLRQPTFTRNEMTIPYLSLNADIYATRPYTTLDTAAGPQSQQQQQQQQHQAALSSPASLPFIGASMIPSPPVSCPSPANLRYDIVLEAPTAAAQRAGDSPVTYLNKSQYYCVNLTDMDGYNGVITSTLTIGFHEESHRRLTTNYWRFWLGQQRDPQTARAVDINAERSSGIYNLKCPEFDRIVFDWNGKRGATIHVRFNCLSTDFSRIKGVKGIPLRLHMESQASHSCDTGSSAATRFSEATYCKIKLFRDKGAERKNKDDARHLERQMEKLRGDLGKQQSNSSDTHPLWMTYSRSQPYTPFSEISESVSPAPPSAASPVDTLPTPPTAAPPSDDARLVGMDPPSLPCSQPPSVMSPHASSASSVVSGVKRRQSVMDDDCAHTTTPSERFLYDATDIDPTYVPTVRRRTAKLAFFARFTSNELYRAIYLDELTVDALIQQLANKMSISLPIQHVVRKIIKKDTHNVIVVRVDDAMVQTIPEEQDMEIETQVMEDGAFTLILHY